MVCIGQLVARARCIKGQFSSAPDIIYLRRKKILMYIENDLKGMVRTDKPWVEPDSTYTQILEPWDPRIWSERTKFINYKEVEERNK